MILFSDAYGIKALEGCDRRWLGIKIHVTKKDVVWGYAGYACSLLTNVLILPFVMKMVPSAELGLWYTFSGIGQIVGIFDGTFTGSISRNITYAWSGIKSIQAEGVSEIEAGKGAPNYRLLTSVLLTCRRIYTVVSAIALLFFLSVGTAYMWYVSDGIGIQAWLAAWFIYALAMFLNLYYGYWITALRGVGAVTESQKATVAAKAVQILISLAGLFLGGGITPLSMAYLVSGLVLRVLGKGFFFRYEGIGKNYDRELHSVGSAEIKDNFVKIWFNAKKNGMNSIGAFVITQTTTLVCSAYLGLEETASYGLSLQIVSAVAGIAMIFFNILKPKITEYKISGGRALDQFLDSLSLAASVYWLMFVAEMAVLMGAGLPVIGIIKSDTELPAIMVLFMGFYLFLENNHSMFAGVIEMSNTIPYVKASVISAAVIAVFEIVVGKYTDWGIYGLMSVQCIVQLCYNNWKWPSVIMKEYHLTPTVMLRRGLREGIRVLKRAF